jgi:hypothetical protein
LDDLRPERLQSALKDVPGGWKDGFARQERFGHGCDEALEAEDVEDAGEVVAKRHQALFAADLVEPANEEVAVSGVALDRAKGMRDDAGTAAHQFVCTLHPRPMTIENILVLPATDASYGRFPRKTADP